MQPFSIQHRRLFTRYFIFIFYLLAVHNWVNGMFLYQLQPILFSIPFDGTAWLLMQTGIHQWLLNNPAGCLLFDIVFYSSPLCYWLLCEKKQFVSSHLFSIIWIIINWVYVLCYTIFPSTTIAKHLPELLLPILFATRRIASFYYMMQGVRYFFLFFFISAGLWKLRNGAVFNIDQMSGILLLQHKEFLIASPQHWYAAFLYCIIRNPYIGYFLYLASAIAELIFSIGFFTKKKDRQLFALFILFLMMNFIIMRISYFEILPLALPLLFSIPLLKDTNRFTAKL